MSKKKNRIPEKKSPDLKDSDPYEALAQKYNIPRDNESDSVEIKYPVTKIMPLSEGPHAPYNFVPIGDKVMEDPNRIAYSVISDDTYTGEIRYTVTAITPILVDSGKDEFYRNKDGKCAMPGSTMRGLIRNNLQILSFSDVRDDIDDYKLMYRSVAGGCLQETYDKALGIVPDDQKSNDSDDSDDKAEPQNVKAGYIVHKGGKYFLYGNKGDLDGTFTDKKKPNYFILDEKKILKDKAKRERFQDILDQFMNKHPFTNCEERKDDWAGTYIPYSDEITYETEMSQGGRLEVCAVSKDDRLPKGFVLSSGRMDKKKIFYVIPEIDYSNFITEISVEDIAAYQVDFNRKLNSIKKVRGFYELPEDGAKPRPVFYIKLGKTLYFGFTPHLRIFFKHSICDGINQQPLDSGLDFAKSMFGYSNDDDSGKSKVFFTDAVLQGEEKSAGSKRLILAEPKPSSYMEYLEQRERKEVSTYNSKDIKLRGIKQYWLHKEITEGEPSGQNMEKPTINSHEEITEGEQSDHKKVKSTINPLAKDSRFEGSIRFQNLSKEELGLLLWSLELEDGCRMNVGKAKPYGYGQIEIDNVKLSLLDPKSAYCAKKDSLSDDPMKKSEDDKKESFIDAYKGFLSKWLKEDIMKNPTISTFLGMKHETLGGTTVKYMNLDEYSKFNKPGSYNPLPTAQEIIESESPQND